jgi:hypothetical protein
MGWEAGRGARQQLGQPVCFMTRAGDLEDRAEMELLEDPPDDDHVGVSADAGVSLWRVTVPLTHSVVVYADGRVDG